MSQDRLAARIALTQRGILPIMGGDGTVVHARSTAYPLGPPTVDGQEINVPSMLQQPTRITRLVSDITLEQFLLDTFFRSAGGVTGGAVIYDQPTENDLYSDRDIQQVAPGTEFPILTSPELEVKIATPEKWGAKVFITDEARDRNDASRFMKEMRAMANTIVRKLNQRAVQEVEGALADWPTQVIPGNDWSDVSILGTDPTPYDEQPIGDFVAVYLHNQNLELNMSHDTLVMNPQESSQLMLIYGTQWKSLLSEYGYTNVVVSKQVEAGTAFSIARGQLGEMRIEAPLRTVTWREDKTERTWVQSSVRPVMYINDPFAVVQLTGLAGT